MPKDTGYWIIIFFPVILLVLTAAIQLLLSFSMELSPWSGGGFGMFSTTDAGGSRHLHSYVITESVRREIILSPENEKAVESFLALPSQTSFKKLSEKLSSVETQDEGPSYIEVQVWKKKFNPQTLEPSTHLIKTFSTGGGP